MGIKERELFDEFGADDNDDGFEAPVNAQELLEFVRRERVKQKKRMVENNSNKLTIIPGGDPDMLRKKGYDRATGKKIEVGVEVKTLFKHQSQLVGAVMTMDTVGNYFLVGGYGCVSGDTLLTTRNGDVFIRDFSGGEILTYNEDTKKIEWAVAGVAIDYDARPMYRLSLECGRYIDCTEDHLFMDSDGRWVALKELFFCVGQRRLLLSLHDPLVTSSDSDPSIHGQGSCHCSQKAQGSRSDYLAYLRSGDGQPHLVRGNDQGTSRQQDDAHEHSQNCLQKDGRYSSQECNHACRSHVHHSKSHYDHQLDHPVGVVADHISTLTFESPSEISQQLEKSLYCKSQEQEAPECDSKLQDQFFSCISSLITNISYIGDFKYYDLTVPSNHTYLANGIVSHNCGKSFSAVALILALVDKYNGYPIQIGLFSPTITMFRKTIWADLARILEMTGSKYSYNEQKNSIKIGTLEFLVIPSEQPKEIYAYNLNAAIVDELDELPQDKAMDAYGAVTERTRVQFPPYTAIEKMFFAKHSELKSRKGGLDWVDCGSDSQPCLHIKGREIPHNLTPDELSEYFCDHHGMEESSMRMGRQPFKVFVTTAQGFRGTYQITEELRKNGTDFLLIRGLTKDNTTISRKYYNDLLALYTDNERKAFLEGYFINLTSGRVYPEYDQSKNMVTQFEISPDATVMIGQDLNAGFSKAVAMIKHNACFYIVKSFSFKSISDAPRLLRGAFPTQKLIWYPDASSKEILAGYSKEIREQGIELRIGSVNPPITERIFLVNKLFRKERLFIFRNKDNEHLDMALKTRQFDDQGKPEKGRGEKAPDHLCFVAGTMITTISGQVPIESIMVGDHVLTRKGFKPVIKSRSTGVTRTIVTNFNGFSVESTLDHPFWSVTRKSYIPAHRLTRLDTLFTITEEEILLCQIIYESKKLFSKDQFLEDTRIQREEMIEYISKLDQLIEILQGSIYTESFGRIFILQRFLKALLSIIETVTLQTMRLTISNSKTKETMFLSILKNGMRKIQDLEVNLLKRLSKKHQNGIVQKKVELGIRSIIQKLVELNSPILKCFAKIVVKLFKESEEDQFFVQKNASLQIEENQALIMKLESVKCVEKISQSVDSSRQKLVLDPVRQTLDGEMKEVFNITVEDAHEYFANGILVSNCDALDYNIYRACSSDSDFLDLWKLSRSAKNHDELYN